MGDYMDAYDLILDLFKDGGYPLYNELKKAKHETSRGTVNIVFEHFDTQMKYLFTEMNMPDCWRCAICGILGLMTQTDVINAVDKQKSNSG